MTLPIFIQTISGHIFAVRPLGNGIALVTNEHGMQTRVEWAYFVRIMGVK